MLPRLGVVRRPAFILPAALPRSAAAQEVARQVHARAGSHLQREIFAAETDEALLSIIASAARQQRFDPPSLVAASQRLSHLSNQRCPGSRGGSGNDSGGSNGNSSSGSSPGGGARAGQRGSDDSCTALCGSASSGGGDHEGNLSAHLCDVPAMLEDAMLAQLEAFSVEQTASALSAMTRIARPPGRRAGLLDAAARHSTAQVLHEATTEHAVSLLRAFSELGGHVSSSPHVADFLARLTMELRTRVFDGPVLYSTPLSDSELPVASWALARVHAPPALRERWRRRGLVQLQPPAAQPQARFVGRPPQSHVAAATDSAVARPDQVASAAAGAGTVTVSAGAAAAAAAEAAAAAATAKAAAPESSELQPGLAELMDAIALRTRTHLMNRHSAKATFAPSDLALLAGSFALLGHYSGNVANALDAVLGFAKRRIDSRHLNAVSRLDHTAQLLWALAVLQHRTVATQQLLRAASSAVAHQISSEAAAGGAPLGSSSGSSPPGSRRSATESSDTEDLVTILAAHWHLGYRPSDQVLMALGPFVARRGAALTRGQAEDLAHLLEDFQHHPGELVTQLLTQRQAAQSL